MVTVSFWTREMGCVVCEGSSSTQGLTLMSLLELGEYLQVMLNPTCDQVKVNYTHITSMVACQFTYFGSPINRTWPTWVIFSQFFQAAKKFLFCKSFFCAFSSLIHTQRGFTVVALAWNSLANDCMQWSYQKLGI